MIGLKEYGKPKELYEKEDNINLIYIELFSVIEPFDQFQHNFFDNSAWTYFELVEALPNLKQGEQSVLVKVNSRLV